MMINVYISFFFILMGIACLSVALWQISTIAMRSHLGSVISSSVIYFLLAVEWVFMGVAYLIKPDLISKSVRDESFVQNVLLPILVYIPLGLIVLINIFGKAIWKSIDPEFENAGKEFDSDQQKPNHGSSKTKNGEPN